MADNKPKSVLGLITEILFPEDYEGAHVQKELWELLVSKKDKWTTKWELVDHFVEKADDQPHKFPTFISDVKEKRKDFYEKKYNYFRTNQRSKINKRLLENFLPKSVDIELKRLACNAYIEIDREDRQRNVRMRLTTERLSIIEALQGDLKESRNRGGKEKIQKLRGDALKELEEYIQLTSPASDQQEPIEEPELPSEKPLPKSKFDKFAYLQSLIKRFQKELEDICYIPQKLKDPQTYVKDSVLSQLPPPLFIEKSEVDDPSTIEKIFDSQKNFVIIGEAGIGKTTLLKKMELESALKNRIPIYVDLRFDRKKGLKGFIRQIIVQAYSVGLELSKSDFYEQEFLFLFDHLDQAPFSTVSDINELIIERKGKKDQFIICCRSELSNYYYHLLGSILVIEQFDLPSVEEVLRANGIRQLHPQNSANERLLEFARNPYRLKMLIKVYKRAEAKGQESLDITREVELYEHFVREQMESKTEKVTFVRSGFTPIEWKLEALASLAFAMYGSDRIGFIARTAGENHLHSTITEVARKYYNNISYESVNDIIKEILMEDLVVLSSDKKYYLFAHDALGEFFCAWHLAKSCNRGNAQKKILAELGTRHNAFRIMGPKLVFLRWERIAIFYTGLVSDATSFIEKILDENRIIHDPLSRLLAILEVPIEEELEEVLLQNKLHLSSKCVVEAQRVEEKLRDQVIDKLLESYLYGENNNLQCGLPLLGEHRWMNQITNLLIGTNINSKNVTIWIRAFIAFIILGNIDSKKTTTLNLLKLLRSTEGRFREMIIHAIRDIGTYGIAVIEALQRTAQEKAD